MMLFKCFLCRQPIALQYGCPWPVLWGQRPAYAPAFSCGEHATLDNEACTCSCNDGYKLDEATNTCVEEDPCALSSPSCNVCKPGYSESCKCLTEATDWTKSGKKDIVDYLVNICKLSTYYQQDKFMSLAEDKQNIGSSCFCYGPRCNFAGYERPELQKSNNDAILYGCDAVPEDYNGAIRSCFRSNHIEAIKPAIYFPFGACALAMSSCTPSNECPTDDNDCTPEKAIELNEKTICSFATFGDYSQKDEFTSCPSDDVLLDFAMNIELKSLGRKAKLDVRGCFQGCKTDADCHGAGVFDPITQEQAEFKCTETDAATSGEFAGKKAKVCFDRRTIKDTDQAYSSFIQVNS